MSKIKSAMAIMALNICIAAGKLMLALTDYLREQKYIIDNMPQ